MTDQPFFTAPGVSVTKQLAKVYGRSYVIGQLTGVEYNSDRPWWRFLFRIGLGLLAFCGFSAFMVARAAATNHPSGLLWMIVVVFSFLIGLGLFLGGSFRMVQCAFNKTTGNYLEFTMADGRTQKLYNVAAADGREIKNAIEQAIVAHYSRS